MSLMWQVRYLVKLERCWRTFRGEYNNVWRRASQMHYLVKLGAMLERHFLWQAQFAVKLERDVGESLSWKVQYLVKLG